jgi:hypothetical protein
MRQPPITDLVREEGFAIGRFLAGPAGFIGEVI